MSVRTVFASIGLFAVVCGASAQPTYPPPGGVPLPGFPVPSPPPTAAPQPIPNVPPPPPPEKSVDDLLTELEGLRAQKAALEKKEQELAALLRKKLDAQTERLKKLGVIPKDAKSTERMIGAMYPLAFAKDGPKKDKKEVIIALLTQVAPLNPPQVATTTGELADKLAKTLPELAKENTDGRKVKVLSPAQVERFKIANPNWKEMNATEIGAKLGADFVLEISLDKLRLYQPGSLNSIYEGRAEVQIRVHEVGGKGTNDKYALQTQYTLPFTYPPDFRDAASMPENTFKAEFIDNLAAGIAKMHVDSKPSDLVLQPAQPDRVGRIVIEGNNKTPDQKIHDLHDFRPGQVLYYPKLEAARAALEKAGFRGVVVEVLPNELDSHFKDIRIKIDEAKR